MRFYRGIFSSQIFSQQFSSYEKKKIRYILKNLNTSTILDAADLAKIKNFH